MGVAALLDVWGRSWAVPERGSEILCVLTHGMGSTPPPPLFMILYLIGYFITVTGKTVLKTLPCFSSDKTLAIKIRANIVIIFSRLQHTNKVLIFLICRDITR